MRGTYLAIGSMTMLFAFNEFARATVTVYTNWPNNPNAQSQWQAAAGSYSTISFTELPNNTLIVDQYAELGVHFTDGSDYTYHSNSFVTDGAGLNGAFTETTLNFDAAMFSIAIDFPGTKGIQLFYQGSLTYTSPLLGSGGTGFFAGLISTDPFDAVLLYNPFGDLFVDNLYFGPQIPAPGGLALLAFVGARSIRRRH